MNEPTPEMVETRAERRRRSGVRAGCIWSAMLLAGLLIYIAVYLVLQHLNHRNWSLAINAAIREGNLNRAVALLEECRKQAPALTGKPAFARWTQQINSLQRQQAERRSIFRSKLQQMQQLLDSGNTDDRLLNRELAEVARYAENESDLAEVRALQLRCEALNRVQSLAGAQDTVKELEKLRQEITRLQQLQQSGRWDAFEDGRKKCDQQLSRLLRQGSQLPEITRECEKLQTRLRQLTAVARQSRQSSQQAEELYHKLLHSGDLNQAENIIQQLQKDYPQTIYAQRTGNLPGALAVLKKDFSSPLRQQQQQSDRQLQQAHDQLLAALQKLRNDHYNTLTCELVIELDDRTFHHFETYRRAEFTVRPDQTSVIEFTTVDNRRVRGVFRHADNRGVLTVDGVELTGKLTGTVPQGKLPDAANITLLNRLILALDQSNFSDLPQQLIHIRSLLQKPPAISTPLGGQLQQILSEATKSLNSTPQQIIFERKILQTCLANPPEWAGFVCREGSGLRLYLRNGYEKIPQLPLWLIGPPDFRPVWFGVWQDGRFKPYDSRTMLPQHAVGMLAVPSGKTDLAGQLRQWQQEAAEQQLLMPLLPEYLQF